MSLDRALTKMMSDVPECVATGYVDMTSGMLLGVKTTDSHPAEVLELVSAATAEMFQGQNITMIEKLFKRARGTAESDKHFVNEFVMLSDNLIHVMMRCEKNQDHAIVVVCNKSANMGMVLTKSRLSRSAVESAL